MFSTNHHKKLSPQKTTIAKKNYLENEKDRTLIFYHFEKSVERRYGGKGEFATLNHLIMSVKVKPKSTLSQSEEANIVH